MTIVLRSSTALKRRSIDRLLLLLMVVVFGVGFDILHSATSAFLAWERRFIIGVSEDGGEMITASLIVWHLFLLSVCGEKYTPFLYQLPKNLPNQTL